MEFDYSFEMELSSLPTKKWWGDDYLCQVGEFWLMPQFIEPINRVINHFKPLPSDIILASLPKTGTTWLKSLIYSIVHRSSKQRLTTKNPHDLVPFLEIQLYASKEPVEVLTPDFDHTRRIFATHIPYQLLTKTLDSSQARLIYVTRNPKDTLISTWHFMNKWEKAKKEPWVLDEAIDKFCLGHIPCGPYYDHVMGYRELSLKKPQNVYFVTYEDLMHDTNDHVKKLGDFLGCPFGEDEKEVDEVVKSCSFGVLSSHEVNKSEESPTWFNLPYNSFFRKGTIGDHKNYLNAETIARIDKLTRDKFHSSGFMYGI